MTTPDDIRVMAAAASNGVLVAAASLAQYKGILEVGLVAVQIIVGLVTIIYVGLKARNLWKNRKPKEDKDEVA
jgi:hypothetical protein